MLSGLKERWGQYGEAVKRRDCPGKVQVLLGAELMLRAAALWQGGGCPGTWGYVEIPGDDGRSCPWATDIISVTFSIAGLHSRFRDNPMLVATSTGAVIT